MELDAHLVQAERLDRPVEHHLPPLYGEAAFGHRRGDVAGGDRAVELTGVASLADHDEALAAELALHRLRFRFELEIAGLELCPVALEALAIGFRGAQRLALRQQEVAGEAVLDGDHVAHLSEASDALEQDDLHVLRLLSLSDRSVAAGGRPVLVAPPAQAKQGLAEAENGDGDGNPAQQQNSEIDGSEQEGAERHAPAVDVNHR